MKYLFISILFITALNATGQNDIEQNDWYSKHESEIYYGLSNFPISAFLKIDDGILIYSHQKGELLRLNKEHLVTKRWKVKVRDQIIESPILNYYDDRTVVLGSFLDRRSIWLDLKNNDISKESGKLNPKSKYIKADRFRYIKYNGYQIVMNQNNGHPTTLASLYAYKIFKKKKLYSLDIPNSGVGFNGNIIDFVSYEGILWVLDVVEKKIILFDSTFNVFATKDINYLWPYSYLKRIPKQGLAIRIDCQWMYDRAQDKLYVYTRSYERDVEGLRRRSQIYQVYLTPNHEVKLKLLVEKPEYLFIDQILDGVAYFTAGGEQLYDPNHELFDFDGKTDFVYQLKFDAID